MITEGSFRLKMATKKCALAEPFHIYCTNSVEHVNCIWATMNYEANEKKNGPSNYWPLRRHLMLIQNSVKFH